MTTMAEVEVTRPELTGPQKAAAVVVSLGAEKASLIYQYVEPSDLETLTLEVARLGMLDARQTEDVLSEFYQSCMTQKARPRSPRAAWSTPGRCWRRPSA